MKSVLTIMALSLVLLIGCGGEKKAESDSHATAEGSVFNQSSAVMLDGQTTTVAGITFTPPSTWTDLGPSGMRQASYKLDPVPGDDQPAEVAVFYFGPESGGGVDANITRWVNQIKTAEGESVTDMAVHNDITVNGIDVKTVEVSGNYTGAMGPMSGGAPTLEDYRLVGAVVQGAEGNVFFKLTGPFKTADAMIPGFVAMVKAVK